MIDNPFKSPTTTSGADGRSQARAVRRGAVRGAAIGFGLFLLLGAITYVRFGAIQATIVSMSFPLLGAMIGAVMAGLANQHGKKRANQQNHYEE